MRFLAAADVHGVSAVYEWLIRWGRTSIDAVVLAGDLLASDFEEEQRKTAHTIVERLQSISVPVLYIMGNDDNVSLDCDDGHLIPLHGRRVEIAGFPFVGYQFTPPFVGYAFVKKEEEIAADLAAYDSLVDDRTVVVTHAPALGHRDLSFGDRTGSPAIAALIGRRHALAHIHGHIHQQFGRSENHFNVACAGMCRAMLIELPTLRHAIITRAANLVWIQLP